MRTFGCFRYPATASRFPIRAGRQEERFRRMAIGWHMWAKKGAVPRFLWPHFLGPVRSGKFRTEAAPDRVGELTARNCSTSISTALRRLRWTAPEYFAPKARYIWSLAVGPDGA